MDIAFSRLDDTTARFTLSGTSQPFTNALRRSMIGEVPTLAIDEVRIYDNTSALFDEMLAHRLGLIPIRTDLDCYVPQDRCSCEGAGCDRCSVMYTLSVEGPGIVYSRDLIPQDPRAAPAVEGIPIVKLAKDQKVVLEARAILNKGRVHAKWQPTTTCGYKNYPVIDVSEKCDACGRCVDECPRGILVIKGGRVAVSEGRVEECSLCRLCERACLNTGIGEESAISIKSEESRYIFVVEGDGSLPVHAILEEALKYLKSQSDELFEKIGELSGVTGDEEKNE
ncbi:MAG: DNA-directed RNA polymerase subunit D [Methanoregulaceae archaeon PtaU1.Bin222]|nr:MAG: DNA-directed RNA polymerase subunit D [Methanoregulaceae archaeon PtaU1.Bin222]